MNRFAALANLSQIKLSLALPHQVCVGVNIQVGNGIERCFAIQLMPIWLKMEKETFKDAS